jgi:hypothetical protein
MDYAALLTSQMTDILRIGLLVGLIYTTERTRAQTGLILPLLAGIAFVAIVIPASNLPASVSFLAAVVTGLAANTLIVAVLLAIWKLISSRTKT